MGRFQRLPESRVPLPHSRLPRRSRFLDFAEPFTGRYVRLGGSEDRPEQRSASPGVPGVAAIVAYVTAGVGTVVTVVGDFGGDATGIAAARRNDHAVLIAAAGCAIVGTVLGALYLSLPESFRKVPRTAVLIGGTLVVSAGVFLAVMAATDRPAGHPQIAITQNGRIVGVTVTGEGYPSDARFELATRVVNVSDWRR